MFYFLTYTNTCVYIYLTIKIISCPCNMYAFVYFLLQIGYYYIWETMVGFSPIKYIGSTCKIISSIWGLVVVDTVLLSNLKHDFEFGTFRQGQDAQQKEKLEKEQ